MMQEKTILLSNTSLAVLTVPELAELLKIGRTKAYALCKDGKITSIRIGRTIRIPRQAVEKFLNNKEAVS